MPFEGLRAFISFMGQTPSVEPAPELTPEPSAALVPEARARRMIIFESWAPWVERIRDGTQTVVCQIKSSKWSSLAVGDTLVISDIGASVGGLMPGFKVEIAEIVEYPAGEHATRRYLAGETLAKAMPGADRWTLRAGPVEYLRPSSCWPMEEADKHGIIAFRLRPRLGGQS